MTRLRQIAMAGLAAIAIGGVASSASAVESGTFQNRLSAATIGLPVMIIISAWLSKVLYSALLREGGSSSSMPTFPM